MQIKTTKGLHSEQVKMLVYGMSGVGKTMLAGTLPTNETLIVSAESGLLCLSDKNIAVLEVGNFADVQNAYSAISKSAEFAKYKYIVVDSLTEISDMVIGFLEREPEFKDPKNTIKMWGEYSKKMTALIKRFRDMPRHVIFTALPDDVNDGGVIVKKPMIKGQAVQALLPSYFDEVFYLSIDSVTGDRYLQTQPTHTATAKDRSGKLQHSEAPDLTNIITKIKGATPCNTH